MKLNGNNKYIDIDVSDYEYDLSNKNADEVDEYDKNWLEIKITYHDNSIDETLCDPCLLTYELKSIAEDFKKVVNGEEDCYISDFMEPNLKLCITKVGDSIVFAVVYWAERSKLDKGEWKISSLLTMEQAREKICELEAMIKKFPER